MIKRIFFILFCYALLFPQTLRSCDVCASNVGNTGVGLLTDYRSNFLQLGYSLSPFQSSSEQGYTIQDDFHQADLSCRYAITSRIRVMAQIPFGYKSRTIPDERQAESGLADISLSAIYVMLPNKAMNWNTNLYLEAGAGVSLPTGKHDKDIHDKGLPESYNLGKGALGYTAQTNAVWTYNSTGLVANIFYQLNSKTAFGYTFGNEFIARLTSFRTWETEKLQWIPNFGMALESVSSDLYANGKRNEDTGGRGLFFTTGINVNSAQWLAAISYSLPFVEKYTAGDTDAKGRITCQVSFLF